jgi:hypothetical protein
VKDITTFIKVSAAYMSYDHERFHRVIFISEEYFVPSVGPPCSCELKVIDHQNFHHHISKVISKEVQGLIPSTLPPLYGLSHNQNRICDWGGGGGCYVYGVIVQV